MCQWGANGLSNGPIPDPHVPPNHGSPNGYSAEEKSAEVDCGS